MKEITSKDNPLIKDAVRLLSSRSHRKETGRFIAEGLRLCVEAVQAGVKVEQAFFTSDFATRHPQETTLISAAAGEGTLISDAVAGKLSGTETPQGVFCLCTALDNSRDVGTICGGKYIILSNLQDPGNVGTILRAAEALGVDGVILSEDCPDLYSPKVLRASMGGVLRLPVKLSADIPAEIADLRRSGVKVWAAALTEQAEPVTCTNFAGGTAVVIGNEGNGLTEEVIDACDGSVIIPMARSGQSLNAAMAACILIWELFRSKNPG